MRYTFSIIIIFLVNFISAQTNEEKEKNTSDVMNYMKERGYSVPTESKAPYVPTSIPQSEYIKTPVLITF